LYTQAEEVNIQSQISSHTEARSGQKEPWNTYFVSNFQRRTRLTPSFLPRVNIIDEDPAFCRKLEELFFIDNFFLTRRGYKSNGFFRSNELAVTALDATCRSKPH
jgi:hypothetical protein